MAYISEDTSNKKKKYEEHELTKPGEYVSEYKDTMNSLMDQIINKKNFSYDFNADPLYRQYKDGYTQLGNQAMMNTMANAAALTGGYGNSYATSAGAQANQQYLSQLGNVIPELYSVAMDKYNMDVEQLNNQYGIVTDAENRAYGKYQDDLNNWYANRDYLYGQYMDAVGVDQYNEQFDYQKSQDELAAQQWQQQYEYQKMQDALAAQQWQQQYEYQKMQDELAAQQWQQEFDYKKEQDAIANALRRAKENESTDTDNSFVGPYDNSTTAKMNVSNIVANGGDYIDYLEEEMRKKNITENEAKEIIKEQEEETKKKLTPGLGFKENNLNSLIFMRKK